MELTRRQVLGAFLGAPVAATACKKAPPPPLAGSVFGASMERGHRARQLGPLGEPTETRRVGVIIVGGGPSGLSAAWRFERLGFSDYLLLELEDRVGGTSTFGTNGVVPYPWGAHYVPLPSSDNVALVTLLGEMGALGERDDRGQPTGAEEQLVRAPEERIFHLGRWYEGLYLKAGASQHDAEQLQAFEAEIQKLVAFRDAKGRKAFTIPMALASDDEQILALDRIPMTEWLRARSLTSPRLLWLIDYACRDDYGLRLADASAYAALFYFVSRTFEEGDTAAELLAWPNGNGHIVEHLVRVAAPRLRTGALVVDIAPTEAATTVHVLEEDGRRLVRYVADDVIFAAPKFLARHVFRPYREAPPPHLASLDYGAWMVANIFLKSRPVSRGFPLAWDNVLYDSPSLGYVVATHQALLDQGPTILTYYYPFTESGEAGRRRLLGLDHAGYCDVVLADMERAHVGFRQLVERIDVWRWGHAMARPRPGALGGPAREARRRPLHRVHFAHSDVSAVGLFEEAQHWGVRAAEDVLERRGRPATTRLT